jgi:hypothetical protein
VPGVPWLDWRPRLRRVPADVLRRLSVTVWFGTRDERELQVAANTYQAGDRIVTLAPSAHGQLVTSQRGQVVSADPDAGSLTVRMDDD